MRRNSSYLSCFFSRRLWACSSIWGSRQSSTPAGRHSGFVLLCDPVVSDWRRSTSASGAVSAPPLCCGERRPASQCPGVEECAWAALEGCSGPPNERMKLTRRGGIEREAGPAAFLRGSARIVDLGSGVRALQLIRGVLQTQGRPRGNARGGAAHRLGEPGLVRRDRGYGSWLSRVCNPRCPSNGVAGSSSCRGWSGRG